MVALVFHDHPFDASGLGHREYVHGLCNIEWHHRMRPSVHVFLLRLRDSVRAREHYEHKDRVRALDSRMSSHWTPPGKGERIVWQTEGTWRTVCPRRCP